MKTIHAIILGAALVLAVGIHAAITTYYSPYNMCVRISEVEGYKDPVARCARLLRRIEARSDNRSTLQ